MKKTIIKITLILCLFLININAFSKIPSMVINSYQAYLHVNSSNFSAKLKKAMTNVVAGQVWVRVMNSFRKRITSTLGIDITNINKMKKIGIDIKAESAIVFSDIFFTQSFYSVLKLKNENSFYNFLKKKIEKGTNKKCEIKKEIINNNTIMVFNIDESPKYAIYKTGKYYLVSKNFGLIVKAAQDIKNKLTLETSKFHKKTQAKFSKSFSTLYVKGSVLSQLINSYLLLKGRSGKINFDPGILNIFINHAMGFFIEKKSISIKIYSTINEDHKKAEIFTDMGNTGGFGLNINTYLPPRPYIYFSLNSKTGNIIEFIKNIYPNFNKKYAKFLKKVDKISNTNLRLSFIRYLKYKAGFALYTFDPRILILNKQAIRKSKWIMFVESWNPGGMNYALLKVMPDMGKYFKGATVRRTFIKGYYFYRIRYKNSKFYIGICNNYVILSTNRKLVSNVIFRMINLKGTDFLDNLKAKEFKENFEDGSSFNIFVNFKKIFKNSILPTFANDMGIRLKNLNNVFLTSKIEDEYSYTVLKITFK